MQKIMFNDRYGLTRAVLEGRKTMTRRIMTPQPYWVSGDGHIYNDSKPPRFKVGEVVAVAQSYREIEKEIEREGLHLTLKDSILKSPGYRNKMFVKAEFMPIQIRITAVRVERLQDISDEDCLREGVNGESIFDDNDYCTVQGIQPWFNSPRDAFAALINKISGKCIWKSNPWVYVYEFELVKED